MDTFQSKFYGNKALYEMLTDTVNGGHLCHAYLFYGAKGIGKKTLAMHLAAGVLCKASKKPCFQCTSCKKVMSLSHPDLIVLDAKDSRNSIHIDRIREIRQDAYILPNESDCKVYVIPNTQNMSTGAFNALLKVLEEPPKTAMFILTAESKASVAQTILSRCIPYGVNPLSVSDCEEALSDMLPAISAKERRKAAIRSDGILGRAVDILSDGEYAEIEKIRREVLAALSAVNEYGLLKAFAAVKTDRQRLKEVLEGLLADLRLIMRLKAGAQCEADEIHHELFYSLTMTQIDDMVKIVERAGAMADGNAAIPLLTSYICSELMKIAE